MIDAAYWISPSNHIIHLNGVSGSTHIDVVFNNPELFNFTEDELKKKYDEHDERYRSEGVAREEIILELVKKGWMRIRRYKNQHWSFTIGKETKRVKDHIFDWASKISSPEGLFGERERDLYMPVKIYSVGDSKTSSYTVKTILSGVMYESNEQMDKANILIEKKLFKNNWVDILKNI